MRGISPSSWMIPGDCLRSLALIPDASVHGMITDPPYCSGGTNTAERTTRTTSDKYVSGGQKQVLPNFHGDNRDQRSFVEWLTQVLAACYRACEPGAPALVFSDWRQLPSVADAYQAAGFRWMGVVSWDKTPRSRPRLGGFRQQCEYIVWGRKPGKPTNMIEGTLPGSITCAPLTTGKNKQHQAQKPTEVMRQLVKVVPEGMTILDPFAGSGSTGVAALAEGRRFVGIEMSEHYYQVAIDRLAAMENEV